MSDAEFECPEVAALRALAEARGWSVYTKGPEDFGVTLRGDVTLMLKRDALADDIWSLSIDIQTEELPHDPAGHCQVNRSQNELATARLVC